MTIPPVGTLPRNVFTLVGGYPESEKSGGMIHCLSRNGRAVVFQTLDCPMPEMPKGVDSEDVGYHGRRWELSVRHVFWTLEIIQTLLAAVDFENANWVHVKRTPHGYRLHPFQKPLHKMITCPLWAPSIYQEELDITRWGGAAQANGFWKNKPVDVWYGWNEDMTELLNHAMTAAYAVRHMDLTYEVYGHLLDSDGNVLGLVTEATWGRPLRLEDRMLAYEAVSKLQKGWCIFNSIGSDSRGILIAGNKARMSDLPSIKYYAPGNREKFEQHAERRHWEALEEVFREIEAGVDPVFPHRQFMETTDLVVCVPCPAPERPFPAKVIFSAIFGMKHMDYNDIPASLIARETRATQMIIKRAIERWDDLLLDVPSAVVNRKRRQTKDRRQPIARRPVYRDYGFPTRRDIRAISPGSDCTAESEPSQCSRFEEIF